MEHYPIALRILLQSTPEGFDLKAAIAALEQIEGVRDVHHVHAWSVTSGRNLFSAHVCVQSLAEDGERVLRSATDRLKQQFKIYFSTIQVEEECHLGEEGAADIDITGGSGATRTKGHPGRAQRGAEAASGSRAPGAGSAPTKRNPNG
jgi:cobalt-zinc-cadmium efflux system protein